MALEAIYRKYILSCPQCDCHKSYIEWVLCPSRPFRLIKEVKKNCRVKRKRNCRLKSNSNILARAGVACAKTAAV